MSGGGDHNVVYTAYTPLSEKLIITKINTAILYEPVFRSALQEPPSKWRLQKPLQDLIEAPFQGRDLNQPQKLLAGVLGLLGADWLNLEEQEPRSGALAQKTSASPFGRRIHYCGKSEDSDDFTAEVQFSDESVDNTNTVHVCGASTKSEDPFTLRGREGVKEVGGQSLARIM